MIILNRWEVHLVNLNPVIGTKPGKIRPCVVVQNDTLNSAGHPSTTILPISSKDAGAPWQMAPLRVSLPRNAAGLEKDSVILVDQILTWDNRCFIRRVGELPPDKIRELRVALAEVYDWLTAS